MKYSMSNLSRIKISDFRPLKGKVFVTELESGETVTKSGIIITDDNMQNRGIRPRWGKVWAIGADVEDIEVGQWILTEHGRWTSKITFEIDDETVNVWSVEYPASVLMVSDEDPNESVASSNPAYSFATRKFHR
jgi:co-chaperonin GroES (HSP10)